MSEEWRIYQGSGEAEPDKIESQLPDPPRWRDFRWEGDGAADPHHARRFGGASAGHRYIASEKVKDMVNAALYLRRPLLVTGKPGTGKSSLAYAVAHELGLGRVLIWPITSRATLRDALYRYDAIGRLQEANLRQETGPPPVRRPHRRRSLRRTPDIGQFIRLGPLGTALLPTKSDRRPRVLLIDEIDKSDIDLPNDLLNIFEEGEYEIPELARLAEKQPVVQVYPHDSQATVPITRGRVRCRAFPFVVMTSNGERELPAPFLRRCLRLDIDEPTPDDLAQIVDAHFGDLTPAQRTQRNDLLTHFLQEREKGDLATDQLLNAIYLAINHVDLDVAWDERDSLMAVVLRHLDALSGS